MTISFQKDLCITAGAKRHTFFTKLSGQLYKIVNFPIKDDALAAIMGEHWL